ncbi:uncharacterized protein [Primulina eburnea]|uniref:uncharacterized protein isoform X2 n=1 Tax=Primulina eburnea TaxID=1245227 RepID=UPI003C6C2E33
MELASFSPPQIKLILRVDALEQEVYDALMLVKVFVFYFVLLPIKYHFRSMSVFAYILSGDVIVFKVLGFLSQRLGRDAREGKRRQYNLIGDEIKKLISIVTIRAWLYTDPEMSVF